MHSFRYVGRELHCEDVALSDLVRKHGTPLYVYSQATLTDHYSKLDGSLAPLDHLICFAMKSNSNLAVIRTFADLGGGFDTVSAGEIQRVIAAGGDPGKCVFAGVGKTEEEIAFALKQGIYSFNVESEAELARISKVAVKLKKIAPVAVRVNPNVDAHTHANFFSIGGGIGIVYKEALASGDASWWKTAAGRKILTPDLYAKTLVPLLKPLGLKILLEPVGS